MEDPERAAQVMHAVSPEDDSPESASPRRWPAEITGMTDRSLTGPGKKAARRLGPLFIDAVASTSVPLLALYRCASEKCQHGRQQRRCG